MWTHCSTVNLVMELQLCGVGRRWQRFDVVNASKLRYCFVFVIFNMGQDLRNVPPQQISFLRGTADRWTHSDSLMNLCSTDNLFKNLKTCLYPYLRWQTRLCPQPNVHHLKSSSPCKVSVLPPSLCLCSWFLLFTVNFLLQVFIIWASTQTKWHTR